jgi:putative cell wall-binding protein
VGDSETFGPVTIDVISADADSVRVVITEPTSPASYVKRLAGPDRYATAAAVSAEVFSDPSAVDTVFVATGSNFPDALGAAAAAGHVGAPVLLVGDTVPGATAAELNRLNPTNIYVVGGPAVVSDSVVASLGAFGAVDRLAGSNRYATAAAVSASVFVNPASVDAAFVATGSNFPDALGAAAAAGHLGSPVLLVGATVPGATAAELLRLNPLTTVYIAGGTSVVSNAVAAAL